MLNNDYVHKRIFLLSIEDRDGFAAKIKSFDWDVIAARRCDNLVSRFIGSATSVAVIDFRNIPQEAITEIQELSNFIEANDLLLIAAIDIENEDMIAYAHKVGATYIIEADGVNSYWRANLDSAFEVLTRLQDYGTSNIMEERQSRTINFSWVFNKNDNSFESGTSINEVINQGFSKAMQEYFRQIYPKTRLLRFLSYYQRRLAISAYRRLHNGEDQSGFSLNIGDRNYIHHLEMDENNIRGYMEEVSEFKAWRSHDILTGVRSGGFARNHLLNWNRTVDGPLSMIILGLRQLESINSRFGRIQGNALIQQAGERICKALSPNDSRFVARITGREFLVLYNSAINIDELQAVAENIINDVTQSYDIDDEKYYITARAAICQAYNNEDGMAVLRRASMTLSEVMKHSNVTVGVADTTQDDYPQYDENIEREMMNAVEKGQIEIVLQPQFDVDNGLMLGAEALARWNHPRLGKLGADILFSVADRCDYRDILSQHIQNIALETCSNWPENLGELRLSVNVTPHQMSNIQFADEFIKIVKDSGFDPYRLTIELTEENLIENIDNASKSLLKLRSEGIKIAIDDFGTGYSSLAYITELPLDYLKLDKALIRNILRSNKDLMVLRSIIAMGKAVGLQIIAEGVETRDVLTLLNKEKCHIYQGYYGSKPLSVARFEKFALRNN